MLGLARALVVIGSAALIALGVFIWREAGGFPWGLITSAIGVGGLFVLPLERMRYHADVEETQAPSSGSPGGLRPGEPLDARFRRTDEVFIDPTTARRMRVFADLSTGERRYRAEG